MMKKTNKSTKLDKYRKQVEELGGIDAFRDGEWLPRLVAQSLRAYYENATSEFFRSKYPNANREQIFEKLRKTAVRQAGLVGAGSGPL
jgi:ribosomal 50S subunit-associated protein YjgA (DUF615 family)